MTPETIYLTVTFIVSEKVGGGACAEDFFSVTQKAEDIMDSKSGSDRPLYIITPLGRERLRRDSDKPHKLILPAGKTEDGIVAALAIDLKRGTLSDRSGVIATWGSGFSLIKEVLQIVEVGVNMRLASTSARRKRAMFEAIPFFSENLGFELRGN